mmetsp:Transcript_81125/g.225730  ORF Transcript_81125/g.225730 Transcript_81125/m.225730 type:complete len:332 (-) Transcript_81125:412-1407(-)|eukprot:CAMPEP_0117503218 /NCGR_PEP_ID=MMETSP0784-20121206/24215_1 /TAXON_ID=39447 /ORGANISM="" /LENGTH=331 /DNA_ID=CAMNT_0005298525 /DNA_START=42 /DNA_END=1037 /DNA_ORIENTATION=-
MAPLWSFLGLLLLATAVASDEADFEQNESFVNVTDEIGFDEDESSVNATDEASLDQNETSLQCEALPCDVARKLCVVARKCCVRRAACHDPEPCPAQPSVHSPSPVTGCGDIIPGMDCVSATALQYIQQSKVSMKVLDAANPNRRPVLTQLANTSFLGDNGHQLFGDAGYKVGGFGGISTYEVVEVDERDVHLYGLRKAKESEYAGVWWVDEATWLESGTWADFSNHVILTCWHYTMVERCTLKKGARLVVGSGAWRNTAASGCDFEAGDGPRPSQTIVTPQTAPPSTLQYIMDPTIEDNIVDCCVAPVNFEKLSASIGETNCQRIALLPH